MKKVLFLIILLVGSGWHAAIIAQEVKVTIMTDEGFGHQMIVDKMQYNLSQVLTEVNRAQKENRPINIVGLALDEFAKKSLTMLWANIHFYCDDEEIVEHCWAFEDGYMLRQIPLIITPEGETFGSGTYQEAVVEFDLEGRIKDFRFALDAHLSESMEKCGSVVEVERSMRIMAYIERFRTAYNTKDWDLIYKMFSDDALIITGKVVLAKPSEMSFGGRKVTYKKQTKQQYLANLKLAFLRNKWIDVKFSNIAEGSNCPGITRSSVNKNMYGVRLFQEWSSSTYSDTGYLFLLWDFSDEENPQIHVRTWQPDFLDASKTQKLPEEEIFSLTDFDL